MSKGDEFLTEGNTGDTKDVYLCFVRLIGEEMDSINRYEFVFTDNIEEAWGENWEHVPASLVNNLMVDSKYITEVHIVRTGIKFALVQDNSCFGMQDCIDNIVALAYEDISGYSEYPEERGRLVFHFGESLDDVENKLANCNILMQ